MSGRWGALIAAALVAGCATTAPRPASEVTGAQAGGSAAREAVPDTSQQTVAWLFGTAEGQAIYRQTFEAVLTYATTYVADLARIDSSVARMGPSGVEMLACSAQTRARPAVLFDLDETLVWNVGHQYWQAKHNQPYDPAKWAQWEQDGGPGLLAAPGGVELVTALRARGITPVFSSNRQSRFAAQTARDLAQLGLGQAVHGETLFLEGDLPGGSKKDSRRTKISQNYCVIAQVGDQLGDFTDLIDFTPEGTRRTRDARAAFVEKDIRSLTARGWFLLPNPMYGRWNQPVLSIDEAVAPANRWTPRS